MAHAGDGQGKAQDARRAGREMNERGVFECVYGNRGAGRQYAWCIHEAMRTFLVVIPILDEQRAKTVKTHHIMVQVTCRTRRDADAPALSLHHILSQAGVDAPEARTSGGLCSVVPRPEGDGGPLPPRLACGIVLVLVGLYAQPYGSARCPARQGLLSVLRSSLGRGVEESPTCSSHSDTLTLRASRSRRRCRGTHRALHARTMTAS